MSIAQEQIGDINKDLLIKTKGKIIIQYGKSFKEFPYEKIIDTYNKLQSASELLESKTSIDVPNTESKRIIIESDTNTNNENNQALEERIKDLEFQIVTLYSQLKDVINELKELRK